MTMLSEVKANGHAEPVTKLWNTRINAVEKRLVALAAQNEMRIAALRDAIGDYIASELAERDTEIECLKKRNAALENRLQEKATVDQRVEEIVKRVDARQCAREEAKRGPPGLEAPRVTKASAAFLAFLAATESQKLLGNPSASNIG